MNAELDRLRKEMTREEFVKSQLNMPYCPTQFGLNNVKCYGMCSVKRICQECWTEAIKDIQFKDDITIIESEIIDFTPSTPLAYKTTFSTGAWRNNKEGKGRFDLIPWGAVWELAKHCEEGAKAHGERNVDKGIPIHDLVDSASRHIAQYMLGFTDENHLRSAFWNLAWAIQFEVYKPELQDIPSRCSHE